MTREQIIETMARAICDQWGYVWDGDPEDAQTAPEDNVGYDERPSKELYRQAATAAMSALEAAGLVVVPKEATDAMIEAAHVAMFETPFTGETMVMVGAGLDAAMIKAAPAMLASGDRRIKFDMVHNLMLFCGR